MKKSYSVLFIGNSYTYFNDMPNAIFEKMAKGAGYDVEVTAITEGGYKLSQWADPSDKHGALACEALSGKKRYDFVVLQEQSVLPASENVQLFYSAVRTLCSKIRAIGATPVLYSTWGRKTGSPTLDEHGWTNEIMTNKLARAYQAIGDELNIAVAHAGLAFFDVYTNTNIELYDADMTHPSYAGSYLAAATLFAKIFNAEPKSEYFSGLLDEEVAQTLCNAAKSAVFTTPKIKE